MDFHSRCEMESFIGSNLYSMLAKLAERSDYHLISELITEYDAIYLYFAMVDSFGDFVKDKRQNLFEAKTNLTLIDKKKKVSFCSWAQDVSFVSVVYSAIKYLNG